MRRHFQSHVIRAAVAAVMLTLLPGCAHVISSGMREKATPGLTFPEVLKNPEAHVGATVIWGGVIIDTINEKDDTSLMVLETPIDAWEEPGEEDHSRGRFIVKMKGFADGEIYRPGRPITVAGEIMGKEVRALGETEYTYPVVRAGETHLWRRYGPPSPYGYPYPRDPFWYGPAYPYYYYSPFRYRFFFGG